MGAFINLEGIRFGRLLVRRRGSTVGRRTMWECVCDCGRATVVWGGNLSNGHTQSCGCLQRERTSASRKTHGESDNSPEYRAWTRMRQRCENPRDRKYPEYGGRGITVCQSWRESYAAFLADVGRRPSPRHSLDRWPDNDGNYEPGNVRWAMPSQQVRNRRVTLKVNFQGREMPLADACELTGVSYSTAITRLRRGATAEDALVPTRTLDEAERIST